ncbi:MAG: TIGR00730 family Rossman fold protein [Deltaproteobacteria bacterium]|nr:TIGR00730 family Rossman fold protein [Deltaproteobacteria bacterium]
MNDVSSGHDNHPPRRFRRVAIYCGSSSRVHPDYLAAAREVGRGLARRGIGVVYGGGRSGLMGEVADGALAEGGQVTGIITEKLVGFEVGHTGLSVQEIVPTMHARKSRMAELADAFIALPGGLGTLEELFEAATWTQLNDHLKPVGLLEMRGYWSHLWRFLEHAGDEGFIRPAHRTIIQIGDTLDDLLAKLARVELPIVGTWQP